MNVHNFILNNEETMCTFKTHQFWKLLNFCPHFSQIAMTQESDVYENVRIASKNDHKSLKCIHCGYIRSNQCTNGENKSHSTGTIDFKKLVALYYATLGITTLSFHLISRLKFEVTLQDKL